jgi:hypothetical protein
MIGGREGRNLRFQRFALGGVLAFGTAEWLGNAAAHYIFSGTLILTLVIEIWQERKSR